MNKQAQLDRLFEGWKKKHAQAADKATFPSENPTMDFKNNFIHDGFLNEEENGTILFILKESNISKDHQLLAIGEERTFWAKANREEEKKGYTPRLRMLAEEINKKEKLGMAGRWWEYSAYMNINKRGGYGNCNPARLNAYCAVYGEEFIKKQIEIIAPKVLVLLGNDTFRTKKTAALLKFENIAPKIYRAYHPSCRRLSDQAYLETLKEN